MFDETKENTVKDNTILLPDRMDFNDFLQTAYTRYNGTRMPLLKALNKSFEDMAKQAYESGNKCSISLNIDFTPGKHDDMKLEAHIKERDPKWESVQLPAYSDHQGRLYAEPYEQTKLPVTSRIERTAN